MKKSDMAIITPSVIAHETIYMKLPFISIMTGTDQKDIFKCLEGKKFISMKNLNKNKLLHNIIYLDKNLKKFQLKMKDLM